MPADDGPFSACVRAGRLPALLGFRRRGCGLELSASSPCPQGVGSTHLGPGRRLAHSAPAQGRDEGAGARPSFRGLLRFSSPLAVNIQPRLRPPPSAQERTFSPKHRRFCLFPTSFHVDGALLTPAAARYASDLGPRAAPRPGEPLTLYVLGEVTAAWATGGDAPALVSALGSLQDVWGPDFVSSRLRWKPDDKVTLVEVRGWRLPQPAVLPMEEAFGGCQSWVDLPLAGGSAEALFRDARPALSSGQFAERQAALRERLAGLPGLEALPLPGYV